MSNTVGVLLLSIPNSYGELISIYENYEQASKEAKRLQEDNKSLSRKYYADEYEVNKINRLKELECQVIQ